MVGYALLSNKPVETILSRQWPEQQIQVAGANETYSAPLQYVFDKDSKLLTILTPIDVSHGFGNALSHVRAKLPDFESVEVHILAGVVGPGVTERHIISVYVPPKGDIHFFDSKASNRETFFANEPRFNWRRFFPSLWNALSPRPESSFNLHDGEEERKAVYSVLGTQSFFDGASCGYHHAAQLLGLRQLIRNNDSVLVNNLLGKLSNPVRRSAAALKGTAFESRADNRFSAFMKKAWFDTYLRGKTEEARQSLHFGHYFMGWPATKGTLGKAVYFLTLGFIVNPLINTLKLPELIVNGLSETFSFLKNSLIGWSPVHPAAQYLRSGLLLTTLALQGLSKGLYFAIRTVTSPITSFKEAWAVHPALGILSGVVSLAAYAALVFFAAPAVAPLLMAAGPAVAPVLNALAYPLVQLVGLLGGSVSTGIAAGGALTLGAAILKAGQLVLNKLVDTVSSPPQKAVAVKEPHPVAYEKSSLPQGSNVIDAFVKILPAPELPDLSASPPSPNLTEETGSQKVVSDEEDDFEFLGHTP